MSISTTIKKLRKENGLSQEQLSERVGVSLQTIRRWEWGETTPNSKLLSDLAGVLNTTPENLLLNDTEANDLPVAVSSTSANVDANGRDIELNDRAGRLLFRDGNRIVDLPDTPDNKKLYWQIVEKILSTPPIMTVGNAV